MQFNKRIFHTVEKLWKDLKQWFEIVGDLNSMQSKSNQTSWPGVWPDHKEQKHKT